MSRLVRIAAILLVLGAIMLGPSKVAPWLGSALSEAKRLPRDSEKLAAIFTPLLTLGLGYFLGRYRTHVFQNRGEARLARTLRRRFRGPDYHLLNHVTLPLKEGSTQVDHILVSRFGVFVIETKDYSGWIFGSPDSRVWTKVIYRARFRFQNPLHQNAKHAKAVRSLLDFLPADAIRPVVVFTGSAEFKTTVPDGVFTLSGFISFVESQSSEILSTNRVQFCVGRLETARLSITRATDVEHVAWVRRRHGDNE